MPQVVPVAEPGFQMGVQETDGTFISSDVTGDPVINPYTRRNDAFSTVSFRGREHAHVGDSTSISAGTGISLRPLFGISGDTRRFRRGAPTNEILQAGPFFIRVQDVEAALLVSDNVNFTPHNAKWGAIAELKVRIAAILQISPMWRLSVSGSLIYLPFSNEFGVEGFGIGDALGVLAEERLRPVTHMQLAYNSRWADWDVQLVDDFTVQYLNVSAEFDGAVRGVEQPEGIHAQDEAGRYVFANGTTIPNQNIRDRQRDFLDIRTFLQLQNTVGATAGRLLPTETRLIFGANHSDVWFHSGWDAGTNGLGLKNYSVDRVFAMVRNERESMRFKPFAYYDAYRYNYDPEWTHQAGVGIDGPVTDNTFFRAEAGYTWGALVRDTEFYKVRLINIPTPLTRQELSFSRVVTEPVREIRDRYRYDIHQVLGKDLWGRMYLQRSIYYPNQAGVYGSVEDRAAARVIWQPTIGHTLVLGGSYAENRFDNLGRDRETTWEARAEIRYQYSPTLRLTLLYRYANIDTQRGNFETDTAENLWLFTARRFF
ncbi:MAG: hypothetical protein JWO95_2027 [Verrucomicrobiales bacterium]|nr:hypothetical protein [Verrucomicrobiales bacterium]